jgi:two-component system, OmpR family, copper resistance phosphate regulon response regulator CusR
MEKQIKILLVEDEIKLAELIKKQLEANGFEVDIANDGLQAEKLFTTNTYQVALLDISLPVKSGFELCVAFREKNSKLAIIMLTAFGEVQDKVDAFAKGADDYLVKPFHFDELIARIKVCLKRTDGETAHLDSISVEDLTIDNRRKTVFRAGQEIPLTTKEFALLSLLVMNRGTVISKQEILEKVWDLNFDTGTNTIEVYISFLRNKIDKPFEQKLIQTKSGFGYYIK